MKTPKQLLTEYRDAYAAFRYTQQETLKSLLNLWSVSDRSKDIDIEEGEFRCSVQRFSEVEQVNIIRISLVHVDIAWVVYLVDEDNNRIDVENVIDEGVIGAIIAEIANHLEG